MKTLSCIVVLSVFLAVAMAKSQCEEHRERELKSNTENKLVPNCKENGDYEALQCFEGSDVCMCWRPDGSHITEPSKEIKTCVCYVNRDRSLKSGVIGNYVPSCEESGYYAKKQCHSSTGYCWCSDKNGNRVSDKTMGSIDC